MSGAERTDGEAEAEISRIDPRGLIGEAYRMNGLSPAECRAIFLDWALGRGEAEGQADAVHRLHEIFSAWRPDHPMTAVLAEGLGELAEGAGVRRGGRAGRLSR